MKKKKILKKMIQIKKNQSNLIKMKMAIKLIMFIQNLILIIIKIKTIKLKIIKTKRKNKILNIIITLFN